MINWELKKFEELSIHQLYAILRLRNEVFAVEQNCVYPDLDNKDQPSYHLMGWKDDQLIAYARLIPPGIAYPEPSIGRVVTSPFARNEGTGKELMIRSIELISQIFGNSPVKICAQLYLQNFYSGLGFIPCSEIFLEDGIEHIEMIKS